MNVTFETKHNRKAGKDEWLTPPYVIEALGEFDLDPCAPINRPWPTAKKHYTVEDNGLLSSWEGRVWCNPPYGDQTAIWLDKCALYGNVTALTFARTETKMFFRCVWDVAHAIFFFKGRLSFYHVNGDKGDSAGAPSVLIAYDELNANYLEDCGLPSKFIKLK